MSPSRFHTLEVLAAAGACAVLGAAPCFGQKLFVGCSNTAILRGDADTGDFQVVGACGGVVNSMVVRGNTLHIGDVSGNVYIRDDAANSLIYAYTLATDAKSIVRNASRVFVGGSDGKVLIVDAATGAFEAELNSFVSVDAMALKGNELVVGSAFGFVQVVDPDEGSFQFLFGGCGGCTGPVNSLVRRGDELFMGDVNGNIYRYDFTTQQVSYGFTVANDASAMVMDGPDLLIGGTNGTILRVDKNTGDLLNTFATGFPIEAMALGDEPGPGHSFCAGDDIDHEVLAECPCGNFGAQGHGCANSISANGAKLTASGDVSPNSVVLDCAGVPNNALCTFLRGTSSSPTGSVFGDGVRCVSGTTIRFGSQNGGQNGNPPNTVSAAPTTVAPGNTRFYQLLYRNSGPGFCPTQTFNISNAYQISW